jgi:hypothetical protein
MNVIFSLFILSIREESKRAKNREIIRNSHGGLGIGSFYNNFEPAAFQVGGAFRSRRAASAHVKKS